MSPVQISDGLESYRTRCETCEGHGWVRERSDPTNAHRCPECAGRGTVSVPCCCGEDATGLHPMTNKPVCDDCGPREDGPMGAMGFGISYAYTERD